MKYAYIRTSTREQNEARQIKAMKENGILDEYVFMDKLSGKDFNRPKYKELLDTLQEGDVVFILSVDRLGRNYDEIVEQWKYITKTLKADIVVLDMPLLDTRRKGDDLTGRFISDMVLQVLSYVAQKEREALLYRQRQGIECAKERGVYIKKNLDEDKLRELKAKVDRKEMTVTAAAAELNINRHTWYKRVANL